MERLVNGISKIFTVSHADAQIEYWLSLLKVITITVSGMRNLYVYRVANKLDIRYPGNCCELRWKLLSHLYWSS